MIGVLTTREDWVICLKRCLYPPPPGPCSRTRAFPRNAANTMARIYAEWLPASDYEVIDLPAFPLPKWIPTRSNTLTAGVDACSPKIAAVRQFLLVCIPMGLCYNKPMIIEY